MKLKFTEDEKAVTQAILASCAYLARSNRAARRYLAKLANRFDYRAQYVSLKVDDATKISKLMRHARNYVETREVKEGEETEKRDRELAVIDAVTGRLDEACKADPAE